jgi:ribosomal protein S18 acetylase RimI-like enzyme
MQSATIEVRRASSADLDMVAPLFDAYRQFYRQTADLALARAFIGERLIQGDSVIFVATTGGAGLGFTQLYPSFSSVSARRLWILNDLFVAPQARQQGIARLLMEAARQHALSTRARRLVLATAHTNQVAQRLYEALGYRRDDAYAHYELEL